MRRIAFISGILLAIGIVAGIGIPAAQAAPSHEICAQQGTGYCLNDWNGGGNGTPVKMEVSGAVKNDTFYIYQLNGYCNHGLVATSPACPFTPGDGFNGGLVNGTIFEIYSPVDGLCVGTDAYGNANMGPCPPTNGKGKGSNIWVAAANGSCDAGTSGAYYENVYWINKEGLDWQGGYDGSNGEALLSGGAIGAQALVVADFEGSCWSSGF